MHTSNITVGMSSMSPALSDGVACRCQRMSWADIAERVFLATLGVMAGIAAVPFFAGAIAFGAVELLIPALVFGVASLALLAMATEIGPHCPLHRRSIVRTHVYHPCAAPIIVNPRPPWWRRFGWHPIPRPIVVRRVPLRRPWNSPRRPMMPPAGRPAPLAGPRFAVHGRR